MKKIKFVLTSLVAVSMLSACGCKHVDENKDHLCDLCNAKLSEHSDDDHDHNCDYCGEKISDHVDADGNYICDYCLQPIAAVKSVSFSKESVLIDVEGTIDLSELLNVSSVNGASKEVSWSVDNSGVVTLSDDGVVTGVKSGSASVKATSVFDSSKSATITVYVSFERGFEELGYSFATVYPSDKIAKFTGSALDKIFAPGSKYTQKGIWYQESESDGEYAGYFDVIFNIGGLTEEDSELGNALLEELDSYEDYYYFYDLLNDADCYMSSDNKYFVTWAGTYSPDYTNMYLEFTYYLCDEIFYGTKLTENTDWTEDDKNAMLSGIGLVLPFAKFGEMYQVMWDDEEKSGLIADFCADHFVADNYGNTLLSAGFFYSNSQGVYFKSIGNNLAVVVQVMFFTYGNVVTFSIDKDICFKFPQEVVDSYVSNELKSSSKVIGFDLANEECAEYRWYLEADEYDEFPYAGESLEVRGLLADYSEFVALKEKYEDAGWELVDSSYYDDTEEYFYTFTFVKGAVEVEICCEPEFEIDWDTFTINCYWDRSTICLNVHHSEFFEEKGVHFYSKEVSLITGDDAVGLEYALTDVSDDAKVEFIADGVYAVVDQEGFVSGKKAGVGSVTIKVTDGDFVAEDTIKVNVEWGYSEDSIEFLDAAEYIPEAPVNVSTGKLDIAFAQADGENAPAFNKSTGELTLFEGNTVTFTAKDGHAINELGFDDALDYGEAAHGSLSVLAGGGTVDGNSWYAEDLYTSEVKLGVVDGTLILRGLFGAFDDVELHSSRMSIEEMAYFIASNYASWEYTVVSCEPIYGEGYEDIAWTIVIEDTWMYPYGDYGDDGLEYEMMMLADMVPAEFASGIYENYYMGEHYMYSLTGCMCDFSVDGIEYDIMIYADDAGTNTMIRIDIWNWN